MHEIPQGWESIHLSKLTREVRARHTGVEKIPILSMTKYDGFIDSLEYFNKQVFSKNTEKYKLVKRGQFAYATIHLDEGSIDLLDKFEAGLISPMYTVFEPDMDKVDHLFLWYLLKSEWMIKLYGRLGQGSINRRKSIGFKILGSIEIALPPLPEQKKIASILSSVDDAIQATQAIIDQTHRVKQGLLLQLFTRGIGHTRFKQTEIGEIPEEWKIHSLEELCTFSNGHGFKAAEWSNEGFPIIRIQNLNGSREFNYYSGKPESKWIVEPGEFLFAWAGVKGVSFGPCIWNGPRGVLNQHIYRIRPKDEVDQRWLFETMKLITKKIEERAHGFKYNLLHVRKADITNQIVPVPPFEEQQKISELSNEILTLEQSNLSFLNKLNKMKRGLMQDLLTGRVRVKLT